MKSLASEFASPGKGVWIDSQEGRAVWPPKEQIQHLVERILLSPEFRGAHTMQRLLQFLIVEACGPYPEGLKESTIAVGVFNRAPDFDPKADPVVRVQIHRLRQKLQKYHETDGRHDPLVIEIPKGGYRPVFHEAGSANAAVSEPSFPASEIGEPGDTSARDRGFTGGDVLDMSSSDWRLRKLLSRRTAVAGISLTTIFAAGFWLGNAKFSFQPNKMGAALAETRGFKAVNDPVKSFWTTLLGGDRTPIIAYANGAFLVDSRDDLFRFPHGEVAYRGGLVDPVSAHKFAASPALVAKAGELYYEDSYMGSGNAIAVAMVANVFGQMGLKPIIVAGRDLTLGDLRQHSVVLVGSSFQSYSVPEFNTLGDFRFTHSQSSLQKKGWDSLIEDLDPRPGEAKFYRTERDPLTQVLTTDHALITIEPGVVPGRYIAVFGGLDNTGSEGAAMLATSEAGVEELSKALTAQGVNGTNGQPPLFQALLSVRLERGNEILGTSLCAVHPLIPDRKKEADPDNATAPAQ